MKRFFQSSEIDQKKHHFAEHLIKDLKVHEMTEAKYLSYATEQAMITLGMDIVACAEMCLGACPMTGFEWIEVAKVMKMTADQRPVAMLAIGSTHDLPDPNRAKVRVKMEDMVI
jgi:hypothetical protein